MIRKITGDKPFRILSFTDTHLDDNYDCHVWTLRLLRETVEAEKPDMVVFVGDNAAGGAGACARAKELTWVMTELGVPWCPVLGNHEGDNPETISRADMVDIFRSSPCCLIPAEKARTSDGRILFGDTNYAVPLYNGDGKICHKLLFLDGGAVMSDEDRQRLGFVEAARYSYDFIKEEQIAWYREEMRRDDCSSMVFCHIPLPEYNDAVREGELICGSMREEICSPIYNSGMFDAMVEEGRTVAYIAGHDHVNDFHIRYRGIQLVYNRMSGFSSYNFLTDGQRGRLLQGCSVYTIDADGNVGFGDIIYGDRYPQYYDAIYAAIRKKNS